MQLLIFLIILTTNCFAQPFPPDSVWTFGFDDGGDEYFYDAIEVEDGFLLCGEAREWNTMAGEALLVKIDRDGELVWSRRYPNERYRRFKFVRFSNHLNVCIGEYVGADSRPNDLFLLQVDDIGTAVYDTLIGFSDGRFQELIGFMPIVDLINFQYASRSPQGEYSAVREFLDIGGGTTREEYPLGRPGICAGMGYDWNQAYYYGKSVVPGDGGNGFLFAGEFEPDSLVEFGGSESDWFTSSAELHADTLIVLSGASYSFSNGGSDLWLLSVNLMTLDSVWSHHFGGLSNEAGVEIFNASDDGFIIAGNFSSEDIEFEQSDYWLLKVDENGDSVWSVVKGGDEADRCEGMIQTENGFLLFGSSQSFAVPGWDGCAMFLGYVPDIAALPASLNFGPVAVGDSSSRSLGLINTGSNVLTVTEISSTANYHANFAGPATVEIGDTLNVPVVFTPQSVGTHVDTLRILSDAVSGVKNVRCLGAGTAADADDGSLLPKEFKLHPPYPNPFNPTTVIRFELPKAQFVKLELLDVTGRLVQKIVGQSFAAGEHQIMIDGAGLASGIYFAAINAGENYAVQKLLLVR